MFGRVDGSFDPVSVGDGSHSRVSAAIDSGFHLSYGHLEDGLVYAESGGGESWDTEVLDAGGGGKIGDFNAVTVSNGDVHTVYTDGADLAVMSKDPSSSRNARVFLNALRLVLALLAAALLFTPAARGYSGLMGR